jgi:pimeloyl-ACP methyl ester carboxylesterase
MNAARSDTGEQPPNEVRALTALAFAELRDFPGAVAGMHLGIAERAFRGVGPAAKPVQAVHDTVSRGAYAVAAAGTGLIGRAADAAIERGRVGDGAELSSTRSGSAVVGALAGLMGDRLERSRSPLHQPPTVRLEGRAVSVDPASLERAFPRASGRLVVFLHGLMGTEFYWSWGARTAADTYGGRLALELGASPLYLRYNSGLHVSENGRSVAALLEELVAAWPAEVEQIALVGHSMGGLVARSACHYGAQQGHRWTKRVEHIVSLGTPHTGAPLARGVHAASVALSSLPETSMLGSLLRRRSAGIHDLRDGSLVDEDWRGRDQHALRAAACREVPLLPGAVHCFVSASVTRDADHPLGRLLGDTLVLVPSARGRSRTRRIPFADRNGHHVGGAHHLALLNHPEVYGRLRAWLAQGRDPQW